MKRDNREPTLIRTDYSNWMLQIEHCVALLRIGYLIKPKVDLILKRIIICSDTEYEGHLENKERFAIKKYLLIIGKKKNMQVLSHTFTYFSTYSPWTLRHLLYRDTSLLIPSSYETAAWLFNQSTTACCRSSSSACRLPARCSFIFKKR